AAPGRDRGLPGCATARRPRPGHPRLGEDVVLQHLHPRHPELRFTLPGERPALTLGVPTLPPLTPTATLETVRILPDRGLVALTFVASVPLVLPVDEEFLQAAALDVRWGAG
ncbi:MAG TPA: DUF2169 domain-containing protein, partial [Candidatus Nanopelagicales bacterium]|nr:DUF2169 domain-containing protein [Candidatus Nanopelagicales bacterium]